ncbi:hypothetical protein NL676_006508 [Syzygium grande]|nr:hypothetical protein NL676_006508 [Syzygium grande]
MPNPRTGTSDSIRSASGEMVGPSERGWGPPRPRRIAGMGEQSRIDVSPRGVIARNDATGGTCLYDGCEIAFVDDNAQSMGESGDDEDIGIGDLSPCGSDLDCDV